MAPGDPDRIGVRGIRGQVAKLHDPALLEPLAVAVEQQHDLGSQRVAAILLDDEANRAVIELDDARGREHADRAQELVHDLGIELQPAHLVEHARHVEGRVGRGIGIRRRHRVERVGNRGDAGERRYRRMAATGRIAGAVGTFVVLGHHVDDGAAEGPRAVHDVEAVVHMGLHDLHLLRRQVTLNLGQVRRQPDLADIQQEPAERQFLELLPLEAELAAEHHAPYGRADGPSRGVRRLPP